MSVSAPNPAISVARDNQTTFIREILRIQPNNKVALYLKNKRNRGDTLVDIDLLLLNEEFNKVFNYR